MSKLKSLAIEEFKCFRCLDVELSSLTVLCGVNGGGKSTVIQSILLLSQAIRKSNELSKSTENGWPLNGELIRLGTSGDVICKQAMDKFLNLGYETSDLKHTFKLSVSEYDSRNLGNSDLNSDLVKKFSGISNLIFLSAERGISDEFPIPDRQNYGQVGLGIDGRFACFWFNYFDGKLIPESRCLIEFNEENYFQSQLNFWLNDIIPGAKVRVKEIELNSKFTLEFQHSESSGYFNPANVGNGLSYVFPILVALLAAETNDLVIIDRPESHLHPSAQSQLGQMIATFASSGIQIIVETHSEHILNGIRIGVMREKIRSEDVKILFFSGVDEVGNGLIVPVLDNKAIISKWPNGFFDQIDNDLAILLGMDKDALASK